MGVYTNARYTDTSPSARANSINEFFNALNGVTSELVSSSDPYVYGNESFTGAKITIDGSNIEIFFGNKIDDVKRVNVYIKNGNTYLFGPDSYNYGAEVKDIVVNAYADDNCIFMQCSHIGVHGFEVLYAKTTDNKYLIGYNTSRVNVNSSPYIVDISTLKFEETTDSSRIPLSYANMFPFYAVEGTVDFLNQAYFKNGNGLKMFETDILKECSTVSLLSTVSLPSPLNNHLALGAHCIVPLDDEEVSE